MHRGAHPIDVDDVTYARTHDPRHDALIRDRDPRRRETSTDARPVWIVHGHTVRLAAQPDHAWLAACTCCAAQFGSRCHHLFVALDEELCHREAVRAAAAYAAGKHEQAV